MKLQLIAKLTLVFCLVASAGAGAQNIVPTKMSGQPLMYMKDGEVNGCGIRIIGGRPTINGAVWEWFDVSINVYEHGGGLVKIVSYDVDEPKMRAGGLKPKPLPVRSGWLKAAGKSGTTPAKGKSAVADDGASLMYGSDLDRTMPLFSAYFQRETVSIGVRRVGDKTETIYSGVVTMDDNEDQQLRSCLRDLVAKWPK